MVYSMITQMFSGEYYSAIVMLAATFALQIMLKALDCQKKFQKI